MTNALRVVGKEMADVRVVVSGAGAAGTAIMKLLLRQGVGDIIAYDRRGALHRGMPDLNPSWQWLAENTNKTTTPAICPARSAVLTCSSASARRIC